MVGYIVLSKKKKKVKNSGVWLTSFASHPFKKDAADSLKKKYIKTTKN